MKQLNNESGFTLIEVIIVVGITAILASIMLTYSSTSRNQIRLYTEEVKVAETITRAKSLTVATYNEPTVPCGYGVFFDYAAQSYQLFRYNAADCASIQKIDFADREGVVTEQIPRELIVRSDEVDSVEYVFFEPPDPTTSIWHEGSNATSTEGSIYLQTQDGLAELEIFLNNAGQISF